MCRLRRSSAIDLLAALLAHADPDLLVVDGLLDRPDAGRLAAHRADDHHVRDGERRGQLDDPARGHAAAAHAHRVLDGARALMPLDDVDVLDDDATLLRERFDHAPLLARILAAEHVHDVALSHFHCLSHGQSTSGARLTIFMKFFSRNSRATGPKMRVPRGLRAWSMITAAFSSNAIVVPSSRLNGFFVRTTTACTTSPFLTAPCGVAVLTVPTMMSPTRA